MDFLQTYDMVPRRTLFEILRRMGWGSVILCALVAMNQLIESMNGTAAVTLTPGARQGSPTSCLLFIVFVNDLIKMIKEGCEVDGFLAWVHTYLSFNG